MAIQLPKYFTGRSMTRSRWALAVSLAFIAATGAAFLSRGGSHAAQKESPAQQQPVDVDWIEIKATGQGGSIVCSGQITVPRPSHLG